MRTPTERPNLAENQQFQPRGGHSPVMLREVLDVLQPRDGGIYVDGTFGGGGYTRAILEAADCRVFAIDRDPAAIAAGSADARRYGERLTLIEGRFGDMDRLLDRPGRAPVDGIAFDLGVSSQQLDQAERGFSFRADGPLDMRMGVASADSSGATPEADASAAEIVNHCSEAELADILHRYGEERKARQVARALVAARREQAITRTLELAAVVRRVVKQARDGIDPATRTFQALRIYVNDEIGELDRGLRACERLLAPTGTLAVVCFHSLEDRRVKHFFKERSGGLPSVSRHQPLPTEGGVTADPAPTFALAFSRVRRPSAEECTRNPRARSARLRAAIRTSTPAWPPALPQRPMEGLA